MNSNDAQALWDRQARDYASGMEPGFGRYLEWYEEDCWRCIEPRLPQPGAGLILEAGCGTGRWMWRLAPLGHRLVLSDFSPQMIAHAREKAKQLGMDSQVVAYHVLDICDMHALPHGQFDLILALGGPLSLSREPTSAVREFLRLAKPGGYVLADVANRYRTALDLVQSGHLAQLASLLEQGTFKRRDGLEDHRFSPKQFDALFRDCGLLPEQLIAVCPLFPYLPTQDQARLLGKPDAQQALRQVSERYAEDRHVITLSGRLLMAARRPAGTI